MKKTYRITTPYMDQDVVPFLGRYLDPRARAVLLLDIAGNPLATASTFVEGISEFLGKRFFVCKNYGENEGMDIALIDAGIAKDTGRRAKVGLCTCPVLELLVEAEEETKPETKPQPKPRSRQTELRKIIRKRDGISDEEFDEILADLLQQREEEGTLFDYEDALMDYFSIEPDFVMDLWDELDGLEARESAK